MEELEQRKLEIEIDLRKNEKKIVNGNNTSIEEPYQDNNIDGIDQNAQREQGGVELSDEDFLGFPNIIPFDRRTPK